jgi:hypothetical protein
MEDKYLQDISEIKNMMNKSSQFISLSGLAGIMAGFYALIGAYFANNLISEYTTLLQKSKIELSRNSYSFDKPELIKGLFIIAISVLLLSLITASILTFLKAKKENEQVWNATSKRMVINFLIPLVTGGIFGLLLFKNQYYGLIAPITLIFYGLACLNASKYTLRDVRYLGITIIIIGLFATNYIGYGLEFWALGFGVCHILYGSIMYFKYDRK